MAGSTFRTNPVSLHDLLKSCHEGKLQLPDFQRSWVWDEERITSLISSISRAFPVGALMTLETGGGVNFKPRTIEGAPESASGVLPTELLLDGQQRMTSLYQVTIRNQVVKTITPKKHPVERWFFIDIRKSLDPSADREDAILSVPADKVIRSDFNRQVVSDYSTTEKEFENLVFPLSRVFDGMAWQMEFVTWANANGRMQELWPIVQQFYTEVLANFTGYQVPVIALDRATTKEAVCTVFEKVNTGGKPLDAFELVTAIYAADGHELRKDWYGEGRENKGRHGRFVNAQKLADAEKGILANVANTDFLHVVSLFYTRDLRRAAEAVGKEGKDLPQVTGKREALLNLPLAAYKRYQDLAEQGFLKAAKFLFTQRVYRLFDLPYQTQIIPLAAILADIGDAWDLEANRDKLQRWYWCGVLGELYGSAVESRISRDFLEVPAWLGGAKVPATVSEASFRPERLKTMRMRLSAAYKGVNALLMKEKAMDFRSGQEFDHTVFFGESVDIHHIFPKKWCEDNKIKSEFYDSIINKTPLSYRTNRIIGGVAPSVYLAKLEAGSSDASPVDPVRLNRFLASHLIEPSLLRSDDFAEFMEARQNALLKLIERVMGKQSAILTSSVDDYSNELDEDEEEAELTVAAE
ncbi:GmrSD restriction endonuclease domain-containing protein [Rhizobium leguminosarum]